MESLMWTAAIGAANNPKWATVILAAFVVASIVRNLIVVFYPEYEKRPKWAKVVMVFAEPIALNVPKALAMKLQAPDPNPPLKGSVDAGKT